MKSKVEIFRCQEFETVLDAVATEFGHGVAWNKDGFRGCEVHYHFVVKTVSNGDKICVDVNSTIQKDGLSAESGENSIRAWLSDTDGAPLGNKVQRWVTRLPGWQERLSDMLYTLLSMGETIEFCEKCRSMEKIFIVKKEGKNKGRLFLKCNCPNSFTWLDETDQEEEPKAVKADVAKSPSCPKCGARMILRNRKDGSGQFWGCSLFPACKGARDVEDTPVQTISKVVEDSDERRFDEEIQQRERDEEKRRADDKEAKESISFVGMTKKEYMKELERQARPMPQWTAPVAVKSVAADKPKGFVPSKYHLPIFDWVKNSKPGSSMVVAARAGSGKTTTGSQIFKLVDSSLDVVFLVFNKHNVPAMKAKVPSFVKVCTYNSLGNAAVMKEFKNAVLDTEGDKVDRILRGILDKMTYGYLYPTIKKLVDLVKANLTETSYDELQALAEYYGLELNGDTDTVFAAVGLVIERCKEITNIYDFNDQVWLPVVLNLPCRKYDLIVLDEAQDSNKCNIALVLKSLKPGGHVIALGDEFQSMYGFRGADAKAIENITAALKAESFPLSITYRNPRCVVNLVNQEMPEIPFEAAEWAEEGILRRVSDDRALLEYQPGDMVICRTNAPLVKPAFALIRKGIKAVIRGRDIGKNLTVLVRKMNAIDLTELLTKLTEYKKEEVAKLMAAEKSNQAQSLDDKVETIIALCDGLRTISELETRIGVIFSDDVEGVLFSSIHRVKGLEAERVFILRPDLLPHPMASKEWEMVQERNIKYVAYTRTLHELVFVDGGR